MKSLVVYYGATWCIFWSQVEKLFLKCFLLFLEKIVLIFGEMKVFGFLNFLPKRFFWYFRKWNFTASKIKKFLILSVWPQRQNFSFKKFLIFFPKKTCSKKFLMLSQKNVFLILGKNFLIFCQKKKLFLYFRKWNFWAPRLKSFRR